VLATLRASPYSAADATPNPGALDSGSLRATQGLRTKKKIVFLKGADPDGKRK